MRLVFLWLQSWDCTLAGILSQGFPHTPKHCVPPPPAREKFLAPALLPHPKKTILYVCHNVTRRRLCPHPGFWSLWTMSRHHGSQHLPGNTKHATCVRTGVYVCVCVCVCVSTPPPGCAPLEQHSSLTRESCLTKNSSDGRGGSQVARVFRHQRNDHRHSEQVLWERRGKAHQSRCAASVNATSNST